MRYTTVIDITEVPQVYRNPNARLVYLHLALKSGYHDDDRDLTDISIRRLAAAVGLTTSATRHAIAQLQTARLVDRQGPVWHVKKWVVESNITPRAKTARQQRQIDEAARRRKEEEERAREDAIEAQRRAILDAAGKTSFMLYYEGLQKRAAAGDQEAAQLVERHRKAYEAHKAAQEQSSDKTKS